MLYVDFKIDLLDPEFVNLSAIGISDTIDASTNNWGYRSAGYDGNGIIIYSGPNEYFAFDRTCPYDYAINNLSVKVKIDYSVLPICPALRLPNMLFPLMELRYQVSENIR